MLNIKNPVFLRYKNKKWLPVMVHACNLSIHRPEQGGPQV